MKTDLPNSCLQITLPYREDSAHYAEKLLQLPGLLFLDSGFPDAQRGRYDIFSAAPLYTLRYTQGILTHSGKSPVHLNGNELIEYLNELLAKHQSRLTGSSELGIPFQGGFAGYFSYDLARCWEPLPEIATQDIAIPELLLGFYPWAGVIDHVEKTAVLTFLPECPDSLQDSILEIFSDKHKEIEDKKFKLINKLESNINVNSYKSGVDSIQKYIQDGDCYQVNYARRFEGTYAGHPWHAYRKLRENMAAPFGAYFQFALGEEANNHSAILSFSPERFVKLGGGKVLTQPIKGTMPRHNDPLLDAESALTLQNSEKNRAENLMIVDLLRNDLGKCCEYGSIVTEKLFELQSVSNVHHLVSSISGKLRSDQTAFDLLKAMLPGGSITGAPKIRAMQIIEELEPSRRSIYCGAIGYININGDMDTNIAIRTVLCSDGKVYCWGGGGIVADSEWQAEHEEINVKISRLINGLSELS